MIHGPLEGRGIKGEGEKPAPSGGVAISYSTPCNITLYPVPRQNSISILPRLLYTIHTMPVIEIVWCSKIFNINQKTNTGKLKLAYHKSKNKY
jgi:hypothetical protein